MAPSRRKKVSVRRSGIIPACTSPLKVDVRGCKSRSWLCYPEPWERAAWWGSDASLKADAGSCSLAVLKYASPPKQ